MATGQDREFLKQLARFKPPQSVAELRALDTFAAILNASLPEIGALSARMSNCAPGSRPMSRFPRAQDRSRWSYICTAGGNLTAVALVALAAENDDGPKPRTNGLGRMFDFLARTI
jgi:hypothetical protein